MDWATWKPISEIILAEVWFKKEILVLLSQVHEILKLSHFVVQQCLSPTLLICKLNTSLNDMQIHNKQTEPLVMFTQETTYQEWYDRLAVFCFAVVPKEKIIFNKEKGVWRTCILHHCAECKHLSATQTEHTWMWQLRCPPLGMCYSCKMKMATTICC